jgi:phosphopantothenate-cysteine ligase
VLFIIDCLSNLCSVKASELTRTRSILEKYVKYKPSYLMVTYETLGDYLWLLRGIASELNTIGSRAMFYLAAAVSDFYIPKGEMVGLGFIYIGH